MIIIQYKMMIIWFNLSLFLVFLLWLQDSQMRLKLRNCLTSLPTTSGPCFFIGGIYRCFVMKYILSHTQTSHLQQCRSHDLKLCAGVLLNFKLHET